MRLKGMFFSIGIFSLWWHGFIYTPCWKTDRICMFWLRCRLCFSLLRSAIKCLRGHQTSVCCLVTANIDLAYSEFRLNADTLI